MKKGKILIFGLLFSICFLACEKDDTPDNIITPRADFSFSPNAPLEGDQIVFNGEPREGSSNITSWLWNFGDENSSSSTESDPIFIYDKAGTYNISLQVTDASGNVHRTSKTITVTKAEFPAALVWQYTTGTPVSNINDGSSAPVIGDDGTIYYTESRAGEASKIVAVTDNGESAELLWTSESVGAEFPNSPSIGPDGNILINAWHDDFAINKINSADGSFIWSGAIGTDVSNNTPAVDSEGNIYHGSRSQGVNGGIYSWTPDGEKRWEITGMGAFYSAPAISADETTVYFLNTTTGKIWAMNATEGTEKWEAPVGLESGIHGSSLSIGADGTIYFTTNTHVVAITDEGATGSVKWQTEVNDASNSGIVIGNTGNLYTGSRGGLVSLNPDDGTINWTYTDAEISESVPAVDANENIYIGTMDGMLLIINEDGNLEKEIELTDALVNSPTITSNGTIYVEAYDGDTITLFKISVDESGMANSAWPMKGQNVKSTGKAN